MNISKLAVMNAEPRAAVRVGWVKVGPASAIVAASAAYVVTTPFALTKAREFWVSACTRASWRSGQLAPELMFVRVGSRSKGRAKPPVAPAPIARAVPRSQRAALTASHAASSSAVIVSFANVGSAPRSSLEKAEK